MPPPALQYTYCDESDVQVLLSTDGEVGRLDDDSTGVLSPADLTYLATIISWVCARINVYLAARYAMADLSQSLTVNWWATVLVCQLLSKRRGNPCPSGIGEMYGETMEEMEAVRAGDMQIPDIGLRDAAWPAWSNIRVSNWYLLRKARVERVQGMSDMAPTASPKTNEDFPAMFLPPPL